MNVRQINTRDDYADYEPDKLLHQAYKQRAEMERTHSLSALARKVIDNEDKTDEPSPTRAIRKRPIPPHG